jgi:hypothetical protein
VRAGGSGQHQSGRQPVGRRGRHVRRRTGEAAAAATRVGGGGRVSG